MQEFQLSSQTPSSFHLPPIPLLSVTMATTKPSVTTNMLSNLIANILQKSHLSPWTWGKKTNSHSQRGMNIGISQQPHRDICVHREALRHPRLPFMSPEPRHHILLHIHLFIRHSVGASTAYQMLRKRMRGEQTSPPLTSKYMKKDTQWENQSGLI